MLRLHDLQSEFQRFIAGEESPTLLERMVADAPGFAERLSIYRNNFIVTHTTALSRVFPVVRALVDHRFFAFAVHEYLRCSPPCAPCLSDFGEDFPDFLEKFPPAAGLSYVGDVARLEWAISRVLKAASVPPLSVHAMIHNERDAAAMRLEFNPAVRLVASAYPIDMIWNVHQSDAMADEVRLDPEEVHLEVGGNGRPLIRRCKIGKWKFRSSIAAGSTLGQAVEAALEHDHRFDVDDAIRMLFGDGLIVGIRSEKGPATVGNQAERDD